MNVLQKYKVRVLQLQNVAVLHLHSKIFANDLFSVKLQASCLQIYFQKHFLGYVSATAKKTLHALLRLLLLKQKRVLFPK